MGEGDSKIKSRENLAGAGVILAAFLIRVVGIQFGLPSVYHQDEPIIVHHAMAVGAGGWNTHFFVLPPFIIYSTFVLYGIYFGIGKLAGVFSDPAAFAIHFLRDPSFFYLIARIYAGVLFGTLTVWLTHAAGRRLFSARTGLLAALFLAVVFIHVKHSHYVYVDIPLTFAVAALLYNLFLIARHPAVRNYLVGGALLGWAFSIKYTAAFFLPACLVCHCLVFKKGVLGWESLKRILAAFLFGFVVYLVIAPFTLLSLRECLAQIHAQAGAENPVPFWHHFKYSILEGAGVPFVLLSLFGAIVLWKRSPKEAAIVTTFILVYYGVNTVFSQPFARYMLPLIPALALLAAVGWFWYSEKMSAFPVLNRVILVFIVAGMLLPSLYLDVLLLKEDTRTQAARWIQENVPPGSVIVMDNRFFGPRLEQTRDLVEAKYAFLGETEADVARRKRLDLVLQAQGQEKAYRTYALLAPPETDERVFLFDRPYVKIDWAELRKIRAEYVIINHSRILHWHKYIKEFLETNAEKLVLQKVFSPYREPAKKVTEDPVASTAAPHRVSELFSRTRLGPYLEVYKVKRAAASR